MIFCLSTILIALPVLISCNVNGNRKARVAIIGGGIGGTTVAYELSSLSLKYNLHDFEVDLFEQNKIGGRLATITLDGLEFESGGSIIHSSNRYMSEYVSMFNLTTRNHTADDDKEYEQDIFALFDGSKTVFTESKFSIFTMLKMITRYGIVSCLGSKISVNDALDKFAKIYELQKFDVPFNDVYQLLFAADHELYEMTRMTLKEHLYFYYISEQFINEFVFLATNINYNQDVDYLHAFVGEVALAGAESSLWSVSGGNRKVPEALLKHSRAKLIRERVHSITLTPTSQYALECTNVTRLYDFVVIACPQVKNSKRKIKLVGIPNSHAIPIFYQETVVTFVHGELNYSYFDYGDSNKPNQIISVNQSLFYSSVFMVYPVTPNRNYDHRVFKVFSKDFLTNEQLDLMFFKIHKIVVKDWYAYPVYHVGMPKVPFVIHENLFYLNSIELAASAMEMSVISGKNIAQHIINKLRQYHLNNLYNIL